MMKRADLEALLGWQTPTERRHGPLVPAIVELYRAGVAVKQLQAMLPVGRKFIRTQLVKAGITKEAIAARTGHPVDRPTPERVLAILRKHGIKLADLTYRPRKRRKTKP